MRSFINYGNKLAMLLILVVLSFIIGMPAAMATSFGAGLGVAGQGYVGSVTAISSSNTTGGSQFQVSVNSNGNAHGYADSTGGGSANAGGNVNSNGVTTFTNNSSYSTGDAKSHVGGSATGTGSAAQGTDTNATAAGSFGKIGAGFSLGGGFAIH